MTFNIQTQSCNLSQFPYVALSHSLVSHSSVIDSFFSTSLFSLFFHDYSLPYTIFQPTLPPFPLSTSRVLEVFISYLPYISAPQFFPPLLIPLFFSQYFSPHFFAPAPLVVPRFIYS